MQIRTALLAIVATSALSTAAFAATASENSHSTNHPSSREQMSDRCAALESQYDGIIAGNMNAPASKTAEGLHAAGVDACDSNESNVGVLKLEQAVRQLGVQPNA